MDYSDDTAHVSFTYDRLGRRLTAESADMTITFGYDCLRPLLFRCQTQQPTAGKPWRSCPLVGTSPRWAISSEVSRLNRRSVQTERSTHPRRARASRPSDPLGPAGLPDDNPATAHPAVSNPRRADGGSPGCQPVLPAGTGSAFG